jgi:hypothetical protein
MKNLKCEFTKPAEGPLEMPKTISLLINSIYYFLECVFILDLRDHYRLVVLHRGHVLTDSDYESIRGAKIAFAKLYRKKAWREGVKPELSILYDPEDGWLDDKTKDIDQPPIPPILPFDFIE